MLKEKRAKNLTKVLVNIILINEFYVYMYMYKYSNNFCYGSHPKYKQTNNYTNYPRTI